MKILILGHAGHGKSTLAKIFSEITGLSYCSSSTFCLDKVIWPNLGKFYETKEECYKDRGNHRVLWFDLIADWCNPKVRLAKELLAEYDIYDGMRSAEEYEASKDLFDGILWVNRDDHVDEDPSMEISCDWSRMWVFDNNGSIDCLRKQAISFYAFAVRIGTVW